jgi:hypothetical protein
MSTSINEILKEYMIQSNENPTTDGVYRWNPEYFDQIISDFEKNGRRALIFFHCGYKCHCGYFGSHISRHGQSRAYMTSVEMLSYEGDCISAVESGILNFGGPRGEKRPWGQHHTTLKLYRSGQLIATKSNATIPDI